MGVTLYGTSPARTPSLHLTCPDTLAPSHLPGHPRSISPARTSSLHLTCPDTLAPSHLPGHPRSISPARTPSLHLTCPDTLAPSHLRSTATEAGSAAKEAEERKVSKYRSIAAYNTFIPVAVETLGPMGPEAKSFLLDLGRRLRQHTGEPRSTSYLIQRISMAIQGRGMVRMAQLQRGGEDGRGGEGGERGEGGGEEGVREKIQHWGEGDSLFCSVCRV